MRTNLKASFWIAVFAIFFGPLLMPKLHLLYLAPYLVVSFYRCSKITVLWRAIFCGILVDLLSSSSFFGFTSINYCCVSLLLFGQTRNFFEDKLSTLPIMTFLFSMISTAFSALIALFSSYGFPLSFRWLFSDLIIMPLADGIYALLLFSLPFQLTARIAKMKIFKSKN